AAVRPRARHEFPAGQDHRRGEDRHRQAPGARAHRVLGAESLLGQDLGVPPSRIATGLGRARAGAEMTTVRYGKIPSYLVPPRRRVLRLSPWAWTVAFVLIGAIVVELIAQFRLVGRATLLPVTTMMARAGELLATPEFYE